MTDFKVTAGLRNITQQDVAKCTKAGNNKTVSRYLSRAIALLSGKGWISDNSVNEELSKHPNNTDSKMTGIRQVMERAAGNPGPLNPGRVTSLAAPELSPQAQTRILTFTEQMKSVGPDLRSGMLPSNTNEVTSAVVEVLQRPRWEVKDIILALQEAPNPVDKYGDGRDRALQTLISIEAVEERDVVWGLRGLGLTGQETSKLPLWSQLRVKPSLGAAALSSPSSTTPTTTSGPTVSRVQAAAASSIPSSPPANTTTGPTGAVPASTAIQPETHASAFSEAFDQLVEAADRKPDPVALEEAKKRVIAGIQQGQSKDQILAGLSSAKYRPTPRTETTGLTSITAGLTSIPANVLEITKAALEQVTLTEPAKVPESGATAAPPRTAPASANPAPVSAFCIALKKGEQAADRKPDPVALEEAKKRVIAGIQQGQSKDQILAGLNGAKYRPTPRTETTGLTSITAGLTSIPANVIDIAKAALDKVTLPEPAKVPESGATAAPATSAADVAALPKRPSFDEFKRNMETHYGPNSIGFNKSRRAQQIQSIVKPFLTNSDGFDEDGLLKAIDEAPGQYLGVHKRAAKSALASLGLITAEDAAYNPPPTAAGTAAPLTQQQIDGYAGQVTPIDYDDGTREKDDLFQAKMQKLSGDHYGRLARIVEQEVMTELQKVNYTAKSLVAAIDGIPHQEGIGYAKGNAKTALFEMGLITAEDAAYVPPTAAAATAVDLTGVEKGKDCKAVQVRGAEATQALYGKLETQRAETGFRIVLAPTGGSCQVAYEAHRDNPDDEVAVFLAANSGLPGGALGKKPGEVTERDLALATQEESVWAAAVLTECGTDRVKQQLMHAETIGGDQWGMADPMGTGYETKQGIDFVNAKKAEVYDETYLVTGHQLSNVVVDSNGHKHIAGEPFKANFVFVAGPNTNHGRDPIRGTQSRTRNKQAVSDYDFFNECRKVALRAAFDNAAQSGAKVVVPALVSAGIYANAHRDAHPDHQIYGDFLRIMQEVLDEPVGPDRQARGRYFRDIRLPEMAQTRFNQFSNNGTPKTADEIAEVTKKADAFFKQWQIPPEGNPQRNDKIAVRNIIVEGLNAGKALNDIEREINQTRCKKNQGRGMRPVEDGVKLEAKAVLRQVMGMG